MSTERTVQHAIFGVLRERDPKLLPDYYSESFIYEAGRFNLVICPDGRPMDRTLDFAAYIFGAKERWIDKAKRDISAGLLNEHNEYWADGSPLDAPAFASKIEVSNLDVLGTSCVTLMFKDGGLFGGHALVVTYFDFSQDLERDLLLPGDVSTFG